MTLARAHTVTTDQHGMYHCVKRCVRRAWLCGIDPLTGKDHGARKPMIVNPIRELGEIFAVAVYAYAVMSNHLHVVRNSGHAAFCSKNLTRRRDEIRQTAPARLGIMAT